MFSIIVILFVLYFPIIQRPQEDQQCYEDHPRHIIPRPSEILHTEYSPPTYRTAVFVAVANAVYFILCAIISTIILARGINQAKIWAAWLGVLSMALAAAQYIPQLWVTWRIKVSSPHTSSFQIPFRVWSS
jgi:hypothetical protein